jgi:hypothetical protein
VTAAYVVKQLIRSAQATPAATAKVLLQTTSWMGSAAIELLLLGSGGIEGHVMAVGSASSCEMLTTHYAHQIAFLHCASVDVDPFPPNWVALGGAVFQNCSTRSSCVAVPSDVALEAGLLRPKIETPADLMILDLDASLGVVTVSSLVAALLQMNGANRHRVVTVVYWQPPRTLQQTRVLHDYWSTLLLQRHNESSLPELLLQFVVHPLHGDCSEPGPVSLSEFSSRYFRMTSIVDTLDDSAVLPSTYPSSCLFVVRLSRMDRAYSLETILQSEPSDADVENSIVSSPRRATMKSPKAVPLGAMDVVLISTAGLVGAALCYGISKNWCGRRRRPAARIGGGVV